MPSVEKMSIKPFLSRGIASSLERMALTPFLSRGNRLWDIQEPFEGMLTFLDHSPGLSLARDAQAVASTNVDWKETQTEHVFKADLPGLKKEEIQVQVEDGRTLRISGERNREEVQNSDTWHRVERSRGQFMRRFRLPENTNLDQIRANVENGVLTVAVPKVQAKRSQTRNIEIGGQESAGARQIKEPQDGATNGSHGERSYVSAQ